MAKRANEEAYRLLLQSEGEPSKEIGELLLENQRLLNTALKLFLKKSIPSKNEGTKLSQKLAEIKPAETRVASIKPWQKRVNPTLFVKDDYEAFVVLYSETAEPCLGIKIFIRKQNWYPGIMVN